ncbi:MAG TPA: cytochrome c biogenesis protein CcdA [Nitrospirae bacterium]|nr:thiol:disulfide interchange protein DsbD precursor [bacterium BMS3Abin09]GBE40790.1 thiol:disulfide interchange protein DsbD precursor [bacterium BMS3Bbin09]HDZ84335.1 cytochrome c biogenesis protein CcdA [Nitrospirota bacterium]
MSFNAEVSYSLAFFAGVLSFLSPCVLPLLPSYVSYITGVSFEDLTGNADRPRVRFLTLTNSLVFILGFSFIFILLGASSSVVGKFFFMYQEHIRIIGGALIIIFGLFVAGFLKLDFLMKEKKVHMQFKPAGYVGTFAVGVTFGAGWTPCIGPILGSILMYAGSSGSVTYGIKLLSVYSIGLGIPFLLSSLAMNTFLTHSKKLMKHMRVIMVVSGLLLIVFGIMLMTNMITRFVALFPNFVII